MAGKHEHIAELWKRYLTDQATPGQVKELLALLQEPGRDAESDQEFRKALASLELLPPASAGPDELAEAWQSLLTARPSLQEAWENRSDAESGEKRMAVAWAEQRIPGGRIRFFRGWVAASVILALGIGGYFLATNKKKAQTPPVVAAAPADIAPGKKGAILTLANGSQMVLDSLGSGIIASQNGAQVLLQHGQLAYDPSGETAAETAYNTLTTPKGRQFQLLLPDGTKVWLNAASSIRYPVLFTGKERNVEIAGEAYFEVAKNTQLPFRVNVNNQAEIIVLGTSFNVNAYDNEENINTTLIEGSVRVLAGEKNRPATLVLKPGQQARVANNAGGRLPGETTANSTIKIINDADTYEAVAWKNGLFDFRGKGLKEVMRQLERWYDIEVVYEKGIPNIRFGGELSRDVSLAGLLNGLKGVGVHFRIEEGRRLVVTGG